MNDRILYILILIINCFASAISQILLKKAAQKNYDSFINQYLNIYVVFGHSIFFIVVVVNIYLLKVLPLIILNPIGEALPIILSFISGKVFFAEKFTLKKILGMIFVLLGIVFIII